MASSLCLTIFIFFLLLTLSQPHLLRTPFKPNTLFLSLHKDTATSPTSARALHVSPSPSSSTSTPDSSGSPAIGTTPPPPTPFCHSTLCSTVGVHYCHKCTASPTAVPGCHNNSCAVIATNPFTSKNSIAELAVDVVTIPSLDRGFVSGGGTLWATDPQFVFACAPPSLLQGSYPPGVRGIAALGHTPVSLPLQLASQFGFRPQFSLCLSSSVASGGGIVFGHVPQTLQPRAMAYTPLTIGAQGEYFVLIRSIKINNVSVPFNTSLFSTTRGFGGTMISTTAPYTVLERTVFTTFARSFADQFKGATRVAAVPPFGLCFDSRNNSGAPDVLLHELDGGG